MQKFDLIIVGGGLAGASLAIALRDTPLRIALVEHQPPSRPAGWDARVYAISPANMAFLDRIGARKHLDADRISPIRGMDVRGDAGGRVVFSAYEAGVPELGWILESSLMACEFWESAKRQGNLTLLCPSRPKSLEFEADGARLELADGSLLAARLLVPGLAEALKAADQLEARGLSTTVADLRFAKPLDQELIRRLMTTHEVVVTIEEGSIGGFGSHVMQALSDNGMLDGGLKMRAMVLPDEFLDHDSPNAMYARAGLDAKGIVARVFDALGKDYKAETVKLA